MLTVKIIENNTMYSMQGLHLCLFLLAIFTSPIFSVHCSTYLLTKFLRHLQFA